MTNEFIEKINQYPGTARRFVESSAQPDIPSTTSLKTIEIYMDDKLVFRWEDPYVVHEIDQKADYEPTVTEILANGEVAVVMMDNEVLLNRVGDGELLAQISEIGAGKARG